MSSALSRRHLLTALLLGAGVCARPVPAWADNGGGSEGSDDHGGSGSSGSGSSGGGDNEEDDEGGDGDSDASGSVEANEAKNAVASGKAVPLKKLITFLNSNYPGKVLDVDLKQSAGRYQFRIKILQASGKVVRLRLDALTLEQL
jgi:hypothetical protein